MTEHERYDAWLKRMQARREREQEAEARAAEKLRQQYLRRRQRHAG